jgi:hypothetical protein
MRKPFSKQLQFDCPLVSEVTLNLECRDEIIPVLAGLKHLYSQPALRDAILGLVAQDVNAQSRSDRGRTGMDYWQITVLAAVHLGCNLDYDKLQDLAEQHRTLRLVMGIGDWREQARFDYRRIRDNLCLLQPKTIEAINHQIVDEVYRLEPDAVKKQRADSFVVETNIHYPTESSLILDGVRKTIELCVPLAELYELPGWRQHAHLFKKIKRIVSAIARISSKKGANYQKRLEEQYRKLLRRAEALVSLAADLCQTLENEYEFDYVLASQIAEIQGFLKQTQQVCGTARRRVLEGESVPNEDKLFSLFEPHTQLYRRGKAGQPNQFGRLVLIYEDAAGFISHYSILPREAQDQDVAVEQTRALQQRLNHRVEELSFDRGFHSPENQEELAKLVTHPCLPKPGKNQAAQQDASASVRFHQSRQRHPGVESAIGALQSGNGLARCRDQSEEGFERYVGLAILGRNLHTLGKLLIARENKQSPAAFSRRAA